MLNPAHVLVGAGRRDDDKAIATDGDDKDKDKDRRAMANAFADWMGMANGGQRIVSQFEQNGQVLYTRAP